MSNKKTTSPHKECILSTLEEIIKNRSSASTSKSYVAQLLQAGNIKIIAKLQEEFAETLEAYEDLENFTKNISTGNTSTGNPPNKNTAQLQEKEKTLLQQHLVCEISDLLFHLMVACRHAGIGSSKIAAELARRRDISGLEEKKNRKILPKNKP